VTAPAPAVDDNRGGGPPLWFAILAIGGLLVGLIIMVLTLLGVGVGVAGPEPTIAPAGQAAQQTHDIVAKTLGDASFQVVDPQTPFRPGESADLINVPRRVIQAVIPSDPDKGYIVIYELPSAGDADRIGKAFAAYLGSGTGAIQYPRDSQFVLRRVGQTLVFFPWSPAVSPDPEMARLAATLGTIGDPVTSS
jgi:hypothetical protein